MMFYLWAVLNVLGIFGAFRAVRYAWIHGETRLGTPVSKGFLVLLTVGMIAILILFAAVSLGFLGDHAP